jgi:hypothetical protein
MKKSWYKEEQIIVVVKEVELGRSSGTSSPGSKRASRPTSPESRSFGEMEVSDARKLRSRGRESATEADGRRPGARHNPGAEGDGRKKMVRPTAYRQAVGFLRAEFEFRERRACAVFGFQRSSCRYVGRPKMVQSLLDDIRFMRQLARGSGIRHAPRPVKLFCSFLCG